MDTKKTQKVAPSKKTTTSSTNTGKVEQKDNANILGLPKLNPFRNARKQLASESKAEESLNSIESTRSQTKKPPPNVRTGSAVSGNTLNSNRLGEKDIEFFQTCLGALQQELRHSIVGQEELLRYLLLALIGGGHILIEGVPGLAKTLAVRSLAYILQLSCKRIQFTPDLLPADLIGTMIFHQGKDEFVPRHGPIFAQVLLADEINRAPAKVQSALLEAMGEQQVTIGDNSYKLPKPFFVMATQNPIEEEGTYPLPAAQLDRFDMKYLVHYPSPQNELQLLLRYQNGELGFQRKAGADYHLSAEDLFRMRQIATNMYLGEPLLRYIINIINATRETNSRLEFSRYLDLGASPRASLALCRYAALNALFSGRDYVVPNDIKIVCPAVLRHRLLLSYEAEAANQSADDIIQQILETVAVP